MVAHGHPLYMYMSPVGIFALPCTLLNKIIEDIAMSGCDILNLRCLNKAFCRLATPVAFWEIVVHTTDKSIRGFMELLLRPNMTKYIRKTMVFLFML
jgi:hypothetical protein